MLPNFTYVKATSLADASRRLGSPKAHLHAGGTDLLGCIRDGIVAPGTVVSISGLKPLSGITPVAAGGLRIGALATIAEIAGHKQIAEQYGALAQAAAVVASPQLRNQGTIGGNLCQRPRCWYFRGEFDCLRKGGDTCFALGGQSQYHCILGGGACVIVHPSDTAPALVALGARARIAGPAGTRTVPLGSFFVLPEASVTRENVLARGEIVTEILLPPADPQLRSAYRKVRSRGAWDFALASVALALKMDAGKVVQARMVLGGAAPIPWRVLDAEKALVGKSVTAETAAAAATAAMQGAQPLAHNEYKIRLFKGVIEEALLALAG